MRWLRVLTVLSFLVLTLVQAAHAQETGTISGRVQNGTAGGGSVAGLTVTLRHFAGMQLAEEKQTRVGPDGSFSFEGLPTDAQDAYILVVRYAGVDYVSQMVQLNQQPQQTVDLTVYETTTDPNVLRVNSRSIVIAGASPELRAVDVMDIVIVENTGDRTYVGDTSGVVLRIPLPQGAQEISPQPGFDYGQPRLEGNVLVTTGPVPPGSHTIVLSYTVPYSGTRATLSIGTALPTGTLRVLVREGTYKLDSRSLIDTGTVDVSGVTYRVLAVDAPVVGDTHVVQVSGLPRTGLLFDLPLGPSIAIAVGVVGLLAAGILTIIALRRRHARAVAKGSAAASVEDERLRLAAELNRLDEARAAGELDEMQYNERRAAVLAQLRQLVLRERGVEGGN
ncbi:carboxypeptidase regulatory-like domain-containing protein [Thermomicrobium sp. 4228-Ro]|uniref:carboxypeptidase regulatory-like domain-containing protein n=1 Tax=Thermomicrobium sp. 4228-Ro TaxID=2993937 RepID=UPI0022488F12|nr:carboxypeptidase regulatory-like domain-containing protein [Thermomicrobium sp. 4228-Ro]MCX2727364.1 carboxypeptidase regulatory-like domain-containing protein [Thermomicrobium sp. 4228-Ro]